VIPIFNTAETAGRVVWALASGAIRLSRITATTV
jgi:hypothetical protein